jgi:hypothetical protein
MGLGGANRPILAHQAAFDLTTRAVVRALETYASAAQQLVDDHPQRSSIT